MQPAPPAIARSEPPAAAIVAAASSAVGDVRGHAHDIRNKLQAVLGYAELLQRPGMDSEKVSRYAAQIHRAAASCAQIAAAMLAPVRPVPRECPALDLHRLLLDELGLVSGDYLRRGVNLIVETSAGRPLVRMDPVELGRCVSNLCDNARDALLSDGLIARPLVPRIVVSTVPERAGEILLSVADNGPGIPEEFHAQVWTQGFSTKAPAPGTRRGFGLAVVRGCVEAAGGRVSLQSEPGRGTTFRVHLPSA